MTSFSLRSARSMFALGLALLLSACANFAGPRDVSIGLPKLQAAVEKRFPLDKRAMELFDVHFSNPRLSLPPGADRVALQLDVAVAPPFVKQSWRGDVGLSGRLSIDVAQGAIFMLDPNLDSLHIEGVDTARQQQLGMLVNALLSKAIREVAVYRYKPDDLRYAGVQYLPTSIRTTPDAIVIHLEPQK